ncbi:hypothetical protein HDU77_006911 [Chytriomyces hyalinus]|nr:hypothetical protein HDU77_006911 [Chytriomyces hyalinus]
MANITNTTTTTTNTTQADLDAEQAIYNIEYNLAHVSSALSVLGAIANMALLCVIFRRRHLVRDSIGRTITILSSFSALFSIFMVAMNELWVVHHKATVAQTVGPLDSVPVANSIATLSYLFLTGIFATNLLLALERYWRIRHNCMLPNRYVACVVAGAAFYAVFFIASFSLPGVQCRWTFLPFAKPCKKVNGWSCRTKYTDTSTILYLLGLSGFILSTIVVGVVYENSYFHIATLSEQQFDTEHQSERKKADETTHLQRAVLVRCLLMSIGLVIFYFPSLMMVILTIFKPTLFDDLSNLQWAWLISFMSVIPALDPLWTPVLVLICQEDFREAAWTEIWPSRKREPADVK